MAMDGKFINMKIPSGMHSMLKKEAMEKGISMSAIVKIIIAEYLERNSGEEKGNENKQ